MLKETAAQKSFFTLGVLLSTLQLHLAVSDLGMGIGAYGTEGRSIRNKLGSLWTSSCIATKRPYMSK
jgi:hypothetical protein